MVCAFSLNRMLVFKRATRPLEQQMLWFVAVNLAALAQTMLVSLLCARWLLPAIGITSHAETIAHACGIVAPIFSSYFGHKYFTFQSAHD
jgi:putative flippase GtrA